MKRRKSLTALALFLVFAVIAAPALFAGGGTQKGGAASGAKMTDVGTPRAETLIVDIISGYAADPMALNPYMPETGSVRACGFDQLIYAHLWEINTMKGEQFGELALELPQPVDNTNTKFRFRLRQGIKWTDGVDFTADDVIFTSNMILNTPDLTYNGYYKTLVKSMRAIDKYTIEMETVQPEPKIAQKLGVVIATNAFYIVPKHIWEKENPTTFKWSNPVGCDAYILKDRDRTQGGWFLFERRRDWQNSPSAQISGEPGPKYVLFRYLGTEERKIMAALNNELDILIDITPEGTEIMLQRSNYIKAWYNGFPYGTMDDPCERVLLFNCSKPPYDNADVRWALALAFDMKAVSMATYGGMLRVSPLGLVPTAALQNTYHKPMVPWLRNFTLSDGYKPFDESYAKEINAQLRREGKTGLPSTAQQEIDIFGVGWWKYDTDQAAKILERNGFKRGTNGKWNLPNGQPWQIVINTTGDYDIQGARATFAVADFWRKFGIDTDVRQLDSASFYDATAIGNFEIQVSVGGCGLMPDTTSNMLGMHKRYVVPNGQRAPGNDVRWVNDRVSQLLDELVTLPSNHRDVVPKITEINQEMVKGLPFLPMFGNTKFVPVNTYYWEGFQTADNPFEGPWWWWSHFRYYLAHYKPTGR